MKSQRIQIKTPLEKMEDKKPYLGSNGTPVKERAKRKRKTGEVDIKPVASISVFVIRKDGLARR